MAASGAAGAAVPRVSLPPQITRLVALTVAIVGSYLVARAFLKPASFGATGFYRGDALAELAALPVTYAGKKACDECHSGEIQKLAKGSHKGLSCEGCHGPGQAHADKPEIKMGLLVHSACLRCHEANPSRPPKHKQIVSHKHYTGQTCVECHVPHQPEEVP